MRKASIALLFFILLVHPLPAGDWPQFRADASRSGYTPEPFPDRLHLSWVHEPAHPPRPAWTGEDTRMPFDHAYHPIMIRGMVFFGSSADNKVYALDAATGMERWHFFTESPVRFAPAAWKDRLFVASDDGYLYCLDADTGALLWKKYGGPVKDMILGNGRLISRWPVRGAPTVLDDTLYFCAGIWPSEGIFLYALHPETGDVCWLNDSAGGMEMDQPHGGARARSGVSCQGYLAAADDTIMMPTGRATPAAFDLADGSFRYFHLQAYNQRPVGPFITMADGLTFNQHDIFRSKDGFIAAGGIFAMAMAVFPEHIVCVRGSEIVAFDRNALFVEKEIVDRRGKKSKRTVLNDPSVVIPCGEPLGGVLIGAGRSAIATTKSNKVILADIDSKSVKTILELKSRPMSLAAAGGRLCVGTEAGWIYSLSKGDGKNIPASFFPDSPAPLSGYCLRVGCGDPGRVLEQARTTDLQITVLESDPHLAAELRNKADAEGLYGMKLTVLEGDLDDRSLPDYFADLIISEDPKLPYEKIEKHLRPYGGVFQAGPSAAHKTFVRGPLQGAGQWTHQYCDPANTNCSSDTIIRGPLGVLWFADNDFEMPSRHGRGPAPLFRDGLLFVEGLHGIRALDAYNGRPLWEYAVENILKPYDQEHLNGAAITGSNMCVGEGCLFLRLKNRCLKIDAREGKLLSEFEAPLRPDGKKGTWGYIACDEGLLFGSLFDEEHLVRWAYGQSDMAALFSESLLLFAMDAKSGETRWILEPKDSIRNNAVAIGEGRVFVIDRPLAVQDRMDGSKEPQPLGKLKALDAKTGKELWGVSEDVFGTLLALSREHDVLLMAYQPSRFRLPSEKGGRMAAFCASDGRKLWDIGAAYESRPILNGRTIYAQPGAWDLLTGEKKEFLFGRSYGCGILSASKRLMAFRSATLGYRDLVHDFGTENYGGIRPGCWINCLPVGGLLLVPEASNRCVCSYLIKASIALKPYGVRPPIITPHGGTFREPVKVTLTAETGEDSIRYTLDDAAPALSSNAYSRPVLLSKTGTLKARTFKEGMPPSIVEEAHFVIDQYALPLEGPDWKVYDGPGGNPPASVWRIEKGVASERSNIYQGSAGNPDPAMERPGTFRIYQEGYDLTDGELTLEIASSDDDTLGVAFRFQGPDRYYLWAMDRQRGFHVLALKTGGQYRLLARNEKGYVPDRWYKLKVALKGRKITVYLDGEKDLEANDSTFRSGTVALHAWGCAGAKFHRLRWRQD